MKKDHTLKKRYVKDLADVKKRVASAVKGSGKKVTTRKTAKSVAARRKRVRPVQ